MNLIDLIYPKRCMKCGKLGPNWVCNNCLSNLNYGKIEKIQNGEINYLISLFSYNDIRNEMLKFKFNDESFIYNYFVDLIYFNEKIKNYIKENIDIIVPVPMYFLKEMKRGYNQSNLIATGISKKINKKISNENLVKIRKTKTQSLLNRKERLENLKNAFLLKSLDEFKDKRILLIDDIYTTGSTINECVKILKKANPRKIDVLVIAKKIEKK